jgi:hypothetical protein
MPDNSLPTATAQLAVHRWICHSFNPSWPLQIHWPTRPHANAPASLHSLQPRETPAPPTNSPAATVAPRFDPCTPVRIEPLPDVRAPKGLILSGRQLL